MRFNKKRKGSTLLTLFDSWSSLKKNSKVRNKNIKYYYKVKLTKSNFIN